MENSQRSTDMASPGHPAMVDPLLFEVRRESGKFVVSHPALNLFVEAESLDKAYRQITDLIESSGRDARRQDRLWGSLLAEIGSLAGELRVWFGQKKFVRSRSLLVLAMKTTFVVFIGAVVMGLLGITTFSLLRPQIKAAIKNQIGPAALAQKASSMDPVAQAFYQRNFQTIANSLVPYASSIRPLVAAAMPETVRETSAEEVVLAAVMAAESRVEAKNRPSGPSPIDLALAPKGRPNPD
jgi:hypothetical protein